MMRKPTLFHSFSQALVLTALALALLAPSALASSGSITNVHAIGNGEQVEATYTTHFDNCGEFSCAWFPYAEQFPAGQSCSPGNSHLTYVGDFHETVGSEVANDTFFPAFSGTIKICLYASGTEDDYLVAEAFYTPPPPPPPPAQIVSGSITNVRLLGDRISATYSTNFSVCDGSYCGWFAHAYQYPASQPCAPGGSHLTFVGNLHSTSGSEVASDDFSPLYDAGRICLYAYHAGRDYFVAEAPFFKTPAPTRSTSLVVGDLSVIFYYPQSCVSLGRTVEVRILARAKPHLFGKRPRTRVARVTFAVDQMSKVDGRSPWKAIFPTNVLAPSSSHSAKAKVVFEQRSTHRKLVRTLRKSFRIC